MGRSIFTETDLVIRISSDIRRWSFGPRRASPNPTPFGYNRLSMIPQFDPIWGWPWVVLAASLSLAVVLTTYPKRIAHLPTGRRRLLMTFRLITWAILTLAMLRPWLEFT